MIIRQHAGMDSHSEAFRCLGQQLEEMEVVGVATVNRFALVTTGGDMVTAPGAFNAQRPCLPGIESLPINLMFV